MGFGLQSWVAGCKFQVSGFRVAGSGIQVDYSFSAEDDSVEFLIYKHETTIYKSETFALRSFRSSLIPLSQKSFFKFNHFQILNLFAVNLKTQHRAHFLEPMLSHGAGIHVKQSGFLIRHYL